MPLLPLIIALNLSLPANEQKGPDDKLVGITFKSERLFEATSSSMPLAPSGRSSPPPKINPSSELKPNPDSKRPNSHPSDSSEPAHEAPSPGSKEATQA